VSRHRLTRIDPVAEALQVASRRDVELIAARCGVGTETVVRWRNREEVSSVAGWCRSAITEALGVSSPRVTRADMCATPGCPLGRACPYHDRKTDREGAAR
jgi:hypothetical protein